MDNASRTKLRALRQFAEAVLDKNREYLDYFLETNA